jgi:hypothetical protein
MEAAASTVAWTGGIKTVMGKSPASNDSEGIIIELRRGKIDISQSSNKAEHV